jgi:hypothetical protein
MSARSLPEVCLPASITFSHLYYTLKTAKVRVGAGSDTFTPLTPSFGKKGNPQTESSLARCKVRKVRKVQKRMSLKQ